MDVCCDPVRLLKPPVIISRKWNFIAKFPSRNGCFIVDLHTEKQTHVEDCD